MSDHHAHDATSVATAVLTVSSSRTAATDAGGDAVGDALREAGHTVPARELVTDDVDAIRDALAALRQRDDVAAIVTTGGTGPTADDVTVEAARALFDRELPGIGEQFRARSVEAVGLHATLSRATAGIAGTVPIACLPGSEDGARFGTREVVAPVLGHLVGLVGEGSSTHHGEGHDHE